MEIKSSKIFSKINNLPISGKVLAVIKVILFIDTALIIGVWLGIKLFFPDDFILSKINEQLFLHDLSLLAEDVNVSILGKISFEDGALLQKGNKTLTFSKLSFSPALFDTLRGHPAGKIYLEDVNSQGGELEISFDTSETPCYSLNSSEIPLSVFKPFLNEVVLTGSLSGESNICIKEGKHNGKIDLSGDDVVLRGKIPTPMGDFDVGKIILGEVALSADVVDNKVEIKNLSIKGIVEIDATGKITLNTRFFQSSRLDLEIAAKIPDMAKITENIALNLLVSQLSQYKGQDENTFAFSLKGFLNKPQMGKPQKKERESKTETRPLKKTSIKPQRPQRPERIEKPQKPTEPFAQKPQPQAAENTPQPNDELKKKEDELKRKEEELKRKEEAAKEREERMREEREQREKEEKERREQEEKNRMEEEARIHAVQEEAMNEIRKVREEMEEAKRARENQPEESEERPKPPAGDEKIEAEEE